MTSRSITQQNPTQHDTIRHSTARITPRYDIEYKNSEGKREKAVGKNNGNIYLLEFQLGGPPHIGIGGEGSDNTSPYGFGIHGGFLVVAVFWGFVLDFDFDF